LLLAVPAEGDQLQIAVVVSRGFEQAGQRQKFAIANPQTTRDVAVAFLWGQGEDLCLAPGEAVRARGEPEVLTRLILNDRTVAPETPETAVVVREIVVQSELPLGIANADDAVLARQPGQGGKIDARRIGAGCHQLEHQWRVGPLPRIRSVLRIGGP
jgi:hypothetical protein